ncbi:MAG: sensor histidine kinase N-terminal domain-containing protein [Methylobacter sp.]|uniref:sensor histidine kinase N-terminal domain-containing protein n=1 Tax=Methylobacter sp. TaxID=2051955 RepID=UPI0027316A47|nr:sensor histidine kinase N-terminal domain-containing protein [Methylobacter sp.]MDP1664704.1 sensor histidine kinase N-terminal domain-containing protein [Methylobacter sp.]MDP1969887.1 sensor histidine kinase N-terminal domain-containing protein [Methylobacter sp.]
MNKQRSLKTEILLRLAIPLIFFISIESVLSYFVTLHHVNVAYDRWLLDSARSLTQEIKVHKGEVVVELPPAALEIFKWDESDKTYFKIISEQKGMITGDKFVPEPFDVETDWTRPVYFNDEMYGEPVRVVSMLIAPEHTTEKVFVHVAETLNKRRNMMLDILLADLVPQMALVFLAGIYLVAGVKRGLQPLHVLADEIAQRSSRDLRPIPEQHVFLEVRALTNTINDLLARLELAIATQQRFIANAAHQLRTPLAGLKLQVERAQREQDLPAMKPALMHIQGCADRMSHLTTQLLILARSEPIDGDYELRPVDLCKLARETCMDWVPKALQRHMELSFEGSKQALYVRGDEVLLRELLANLLDNAICYGHDQGNIVVKVESQPSPCLIVEDDGPGIPELETGKVFERFYRIPGSPGDGCGLGLAIVNEIADLHKARLELNRASATGGTRINLIFKET